MNVKKMNDYIERKRAIELIQPHVKPSTVYGEGYLQAIERVTDILELMPAADVLPVKYGEWIFQGQYDKEGRRIYHCSECNFEVGVFPYKFIAWRTHEKYCCGCGSRMDGVRNERAKMNSEAY